MHVPTPLTVYMFALAVVLLYCSNVYLKFKLVGCPEKIGSAASSLRVQNGISHHIANVLREITLEPISLQKELDLSLSGVTTLEKQTESGLFSIGLSGKCRLVGLISG